jgi:hypothetical protein
MAVSSLVAAGGGKTAFRTTLTSGSSWTVPAGVTYVNVTLTGGGGGGGGACVDNFSGGAGSAGGNTTFTGATTATGGAGGASHTPYITSSGGGPIRVATASTANTGKGGTGGISQAAANFNGAFIGDDGKDGAVITSTLSTTPGASISYSIGSGGSGGYPSSGTNPAYGAAGGSGKIDIEYWV